LLLNIADKDILIFRMQCALITVIVRFVQFHCGSLLLMFNMRMRGQGRRMNFGLASRGSLSVRVTCCPGGTKYNLDKKFPQI